MLLTRNGIPWLTDSYLEEITKGRITGKCPPLEIQPIPPSLGKHGDIVAKYDRGRHLVK